MFIYYLRDFVACFGATIFYCIIMQLPKKALWISSLSSALTYIVFRTAFLSIESEYMGYLAASCFAALSAEVLARACKMPATIFIFPAVIPLVPGLGLYRTMLCLVRSDMSGFASEGTKTLIISGIIAVTVAVVNAFFRSILKRKPIAKE
ncbi:MAG: threonine/serine exporter family protein [Clostridia bacterium]|nr:threonine/serine exporter family protein [Clostridia bacterium]